VPRLQTERNVMFFSCRLPRFKCAGVCGPDATTAGVGGGDRRKDHAKDASMRDAMHRHELSASVLQGSFEQGAAAEGGLPMG